MSEVPSPSEQMNALQVQYGQYVTREDDLDLAARALLFTGAVLSVAELGILAVSQSPRKKIAGALAPIVAVGLSMWADQGYLTALENSMGTARHAKELAQEHSLPVPEWATIASNF
jgi:hypothetical protein